MKLYATTYIDDEQDEVPGYERSCTWYGTQADQRSDARKLKADGMRNIEPKQVDVPTDKAGLLEFLNARGVQP